jgi:hypothetical protein
MFSRTGTALPCLEGTKTTCLWTPADAATQRLRRGRHIFSTNRSGSRPAIHQPRFFAPLAFQRWRRIFLQNKSKEAGVDSGMVTD